MNRKAICAKESRFWAKFGCFWPKILIFTGGSKRFGTQKRKKHLGTLFALFSGQAMDQKSPGATTFEFGPPQK